jgi:hypothetical protein
MVWFISPAFLRTSIVASASASWTNLAPASGWTLQTSPPFQYCKTRVCEYREKKHLGPCLLEQPHHGCGPRCERLSTRRRIEWRFGDVIPASPFALSPTFPAPPAAISPPGLAMLAHGRLTRWTPATANAPPAASVGALDERESL